MQETRELIEEDAKMEEFANLAFELLNAVEDREKEVQELLHSNKPDQAFGKLKLDQKDTKEKLKRMYELSVELQEKYPQFVEDLQEKGREP